VQRTFASTLAAALLPLAAALAQEGNWTNKAGHVLSATPVSLTGSQVEFKAGTRTVTYPLAAFLPAEQRRLKDALGVVALPDGLKEAHAVALRTLKRLKLLHAEGKLSDDAYASACAKARRSFREQAAPFVEQGLLSDRQVGQSL